MFVYHDIQDRTFQFLLDLENFHVLVLEFEVLELALLLLLLIVIVPFFFCPAGSSLVKIPLGSLAFPDEEIFSALTKYGISQLFIISCK